MTPVKVKPEVLAARKVRAGLDSIVAPDAPEWEKAGEISIPLEPTPLDAQPSAYVRTSWKTKRRGDIREVRARALVSGSALAVRLDWAAPRPVRRIDDWNVYADGCAVLFPANGRKAELTTMGSPKAPVNGWFWRAGTDTPFSITAKGLGTVDRADEHEVIARAQHEDGRWQVVLARPLKADGVPLAAEAVVPVGFAVWCGSARERAGLKSHSPRWHELRLGDR